jgi:hypothetical protein
VLAMLVGSGLVMLCNPVIWAVVLRSKERDELDAAAQGRYPGEDSSAS